MRRDSGTARARRGPTRSLPLRSDGARTALVPAPDAGWARRAWPRLSRFQNTRTGPKIPSSHVQVQAVGSTATYRGRGLRARAWAGAFLGPAGRAARAATPAPGAKALGIRVPPPAPARRLLNTPFPVRYALPRGPPPRPPSSRPQQAPREGGGGRGVNCPREPC